MLIDAIYSDSGDDSDDDEPVRERRDDSDRDSSSTSWRSSLGGTFQRRGEAWQKERLLTIALRRLRLTLHFVLCLRMCHRPSARPVYRQCVTLTFAERNRLALSLSGNNPLSAN